MGEENGIATMQNSSVLLYKVKYMCTIDSVIPILDFYPRGIEVYST